MKKYEFTGETKEFKGRTLKRIRRISDKLVGGWIERESNLSHSGYCFIYNNAMVFDDARVYGNAAIFGKAKIYDKAQVCGATQINHNVEIYGNTIINDYAKIYDNAKIYGDVEVNTDAEIYGNTIIKEGNIIGEIQVEFKEVEFYKSNNSMLVTAIKTLNNEWRFNIGYHKLITKEEFLNEIHNEEGIFEVKRHREFYIKILQMF